MLPKACDNEGNARENDENTGEAVPAPVRHRLASGVDDQGRLRDDEPETEARYARPQPRQECAVVREFRIHSVDLLALTRVTMRDPATDNECSPGPLTKPHRLPVLALPRVAWEVNHQRGH